MTKKAEADRLKAVVSACRRRERSAAMARAVKGSARRDARSRARRVARGARRANSRERVSWGSAGEVVARAEAAVKHALWRAKVAEEAEADTLRELLAVAKEAREAARWQIRAEAAEKAMAECPHGCQEPCPFTRKRDEARASVAGLATRGGGAE